jgi:hypothetical protein
MLTNSPKYSTLLFMAYVKCYVKEIDLNNHTIDTNVRKFVIDLWEIIYLFEGKYSLIGFCLSHGWYK